MSELEAKIKGKEAIIGIVGLGYVGLPLARSFSNQSFKVIGFDIDKGKVDLINKGESYIDHIHSDSIKELVAKKLLVCTNQFEEINEVDVVIICVPTPLTKNREPDLQPVLATGASIAQYLKKGQLVVLESSTYPGTTDTELRSVLETSDLVAGKDFWLAYSPEREDPGNANFETSTIPKVVGADESYSLDLVSTLYDSVITETVPVSSTRAAEAVKLTENIFRSVNIALVNELKMVFDEMNIDVWEVLDAADSKPFGFMKFTPGPGLGGHCIPIDPFYLSYKAREYEVPTRFIELAGEINQEMPRYVVSKVMWALNEYRGMAVKGSQILIIGMSYKKDVDDMRESPSLILIELLEALGAIVCFHDDYIPVIPDTREHSELAGRKSLPLKEETLSSMDLVLISTDHSYIDYSLIAKNSSLIVDTRNAMKSSVTETPVVKA